MTDTSIKRNYFMSGLRSNSWTRNPLRAKWGGFARAEKYSPEQLAAWAAMGGRAVLKKHGAGYFKRLRQKRGSQPKIYEVEQQSPQQTAARRNGSAGGFWRARRYSAEQRRDWARLGGLAVLEKHGKEHFRRMRAERAYRQERLKKFDDLMAEASRVLEPEFGK